MAAMHANAMIIDQAKRRLSLARARLAYCERLAAWPLLDASSARKADDWSRAARLAVLRSLSDLTHARRRCGARRLNTVAELRLSAALLRQIGGEKAERAAELSEAVARMRTRRQLALVFVASPSIIPGNLPAT